MLDGLQNWSDVLRRGKSLALARIRTPDCPAHSSVTVLTTILPPYKKMHVQKFKGDRQL
jgi:hypothetical protein